MARRWFILLAALAALAAGGCLPKDGSLDPAQDPVGSRLAMRDEQLSRLKLELEERDLRIREMQQRAQGMTQRLQKLQFLNDQLRAQLATVGDAPLQRDGFKRLANARRLEVDRLQAKLDQMQKRLARATSTQPAE